MRRNILFIIKTIKYVKLQFLGNLYSFFTRSILWVNSVEYGSNIRSYNSVPQIVISKNSGKVWLGDNIVFNNYNDVGWSSRCSIWVRNNAELIIGSNSGLNGALIYSSTSVVVGSNVKIGGGVRIIDTDFHPINYLDRRRSNINTKSSPVVIEDDVFIGTNSTICKGVTIGARSIIGAGSIVVSSIPSDCVACGNPAKIVRRLADD